MPTYSCEAKVEHYRVRKNDNGWVSVDSKEGEECFENLVKLVEVCCTVSAKVSLEKLI